jgi:hypothetical protein
MVRSPLRFSLKATPEFSAPPADVLNVPHSSAAMPDVMLEMLMSDIVFKIRSIPEQERFFAEGPIDCARFTS